MQLNDLFVSLIFVNSLWVLWLRPARSWSIMTVIALVALGGGYWHRPEKIGWWLIGPWFFLLLLPMWLNVGVAILIRQRRFLAAECCGQLLILLHPTESVKMSVRMARIYRRLFQGEFIQALDLAHSYHVVDDSLTHLVLVIKAQVYHNWVQFRQEFEESPHQRFNDPILQGGWLLSAEEAGDWDDALRCISLISQERFSAEHNTSLQLRVFSLLGDLEAVHALLRISGWSIADEVKEYWLATAEQVHGDLQQAEDRLIRNQTRGTQVSRMMMKMRREHPARPSCDCEFVSQASSMMQVLRDRLLHDDRYAILSRGQRSWAVMTWILMSCLSLNYLREVPGGTEDHDNLIQLGAMNVPPLGEPHEWTRIFTSGLLHFGPIHLSLNLAGLLFLGTIIERRWGPVRMLGQFMFCMVCSAAILSPFSMIMSHLAILFPWAGISPEQAGAFVGASGGIMGLLGGIWGHLYIGWKRCETPLVWRQFRLVNTFILMQTLCDLFTPQVSMACHIFGLLTGMVSGMMVTWSLPGFAPRVSNLSSTSS